jgi:hypothetical protein
VIHGGLLALGGASDLSNQTPHTNKSAFFALFLLGRVEILVSFVQKVVEN